MVRPTRSVSLILAMAAALAPAAALANPAAEPQAKSFAAITVTPPIEFARGAFRNRSADPAIIDHVDVRISDLNLATRSGRADLHDRIEAAADAVCNRLDEIYPAGTPIAENQCRIGAMDSAQPAVRAAIARAERA